MTNKKVFKISDEEIKQLYLSGKSLRDIANIAQDTKSLMALRKRLHTLGVSTAVSQRRYRYKLSQCGRTYTLNEHYFDSIDTEHKAYWLGFIMADGYNHETNSCVAIRLQKEDIEILQKLKEDLQYNGPIYSIKKKIKDSSLSREYCELNLNSVILSEALAKLGCIQNKTYVLEFPTFISRNLIPHFIRGYFDGDGCISITHRRDRGPNSKTYQFNIVGKKEFIEVIQDYICKDCEVTRTTISGSNSNFAKCIHWSGKNVVTKILNYLYKNATIFLKRKHNKYLEIIGNTVE